MRGAAEVYPGLQLRSCHWIHVVMCVVHSHDVFRGRWAPRAGLDDAAWAAGAFYRAGGLCRCGDLAMSVCTSQRRCGAAGRVSSTQRI